MYGILIAMQKTEYLSKEKHAEVTAELHELKTVRRKEIAQALEYARSLGDLSENAEFNKAREDQAVVEDRIAQIENVLANAEIIKVHHSSTVEVGTKIHVLKKGEKKEEVYMIVGSEEVDIAASKISLKSPIGAAVLGKKQGDVVTVKTPKGVVEYTITKIE
jgi:transcription elongation factor GreA